jgi:phage gp46-like protein
MDFLEDSSQRAGVVVLAAFLASFLFIRMSTRLMRNPKVTWWPGSVKPGGLHIHHLVFGIVLMICAGFVSFAVAPGEPWMEILAALFGVGVGLTVDEFALWLYLDDVYWTEEGRSSIDVGIICALLGGLVVLGIVPGYEGSWEWITLLVIEQLIVAAVVVSKGKVRLAIIGLFIPFLNYVWAIRLARPRSWWGKRFYLPRDGEAPGSRKARRRAKKLEKATVRAQRWDERRLKWLDRIGGAPHLTREAETSGAAAPPPTAGGPPER